MRKSVLFTVGVAATLLVISEAIILRVGISDVFLDARRLLLCAATINLMPMGMGLIALRDLLKQQGKISQPAINQLSVTVAWILVGCYGVSLLLAGSIATLHSMLSH